MKSALRLSLAAARTVVVLTLGIACLTATAKFDKKYYDKIANEVWAMDLPQFDPNADLSDSLYQNRSAVYIARYTVLTAKHNTADNAAKRSVTGLPSSNAIDATMIQRLMVKLNDATAVKRFSDFALRAPEKQDERGYVYYKFDPAFGARIHKPDGTIVDVDLQEVMTVNTGKKSKDDKEYRLAVPGVEVGDILEYFIYEHHFVDESHMPRIESTIMKSYPTKSYTLDFRISPDFACEYGAYNGCQGLAIQPRTDDGLNRATIEITDMDAVEETLPMFSQARQMPSIVTHILNHSARFEPISKTARIGGIRHMTYPYLVQDIAADISTKLPDGLLSAANSIYNGWRKTHKEATEREIADAAWMAVRYAAYREGISMKDREHCVAFSKLMENACPATPARVGVTSSRFDIPVAQLASSRDADYICKVGDVFYFPSSAPSMAPGEMPNKYSGEEAIIYNARTDNKQLQNAVESIVIPASRPKGNHIEITHNLKINPDNEDNILINSNVAIFGMFKSLLPTALAAAKDWAPDFADFLGTKAKNTKSNKNKAIDEIFKKITDSDIQALWGSEDAKIDSMEIVEKGYLPGVAATRYKCTGEVPAIVSAAGNDLIVNIGKFIGEQRKYEGDERQRDIAAVSSDAHRYTTRIIFEIPDGYQATEESVANLARSVITEEGSFVTSPKIEGNNVVLTVSERYTRAIYPAESWPNLLKIFDASYDFQSANIVLKPV